MYFQKQLRLKEARQLVLNQNIDASHAARMVRYGNVVCENEVMKVRDVLRMIEADGWRFHSQRGSHRQFKHPVKAGRVTVAGKPGDDMHPKTLADVCKQAQVERPKN